MDRVQFDHLCRTFEAVSKAKGAAKRDILKEFLRSCDIADFFPVLRLIVPNYDRQRGPYGCKEVKFARIIIAMLCLPPQSTEALQLINFRAANKNVADFADAAYWVLRKYFSKSQPISVEQVNVFLDAIARKNAENDPRGLEEEVMCLFRACGSAENQKWIIRIILKDLHLGVGHDSILNTFHPDAAELYSNCNDLVKVCESLSDPTKRLYEMEITLFSFFRPMLSKRCDANQLNKKIKNDSLYFIENKFDGERFQLHMKDNEFKYYSRNGFDYTDNYGKNYSSGLLTPALKGLFSKTATNFILDGEMMGWNKYTRRFGSKGMNFDVKKLKDSNTHQPCFCVFDLLLINDKVVTKEPLKKRQELLQGLITEKEGVLMLSTVMESHCKQDILDALNLSMDKKEEGIVFKDPNSVYKPNDRNAGWWKLKLEYFEGVMNDLDVIILGGYYGEGRLQAKIRGFLVGVLRKTQGNSREFISFARVASGLSDEELEYLNTTIGHSWNRSNHDDAKNFGAFWGKDVPDVWIKPQDSCVLTVRASELTKTEKDFLTKYTLRFPRILKIRDDKFYYECLTSEELEELTLGNRSVEKLNIGHIQLEDIENTQQQSTRVKKPAFVAPEIVDVEQKSDVLSGREFCVLTGSPEWKKVDVESKIRENGGSVVFTEGTNTLCILVGESHPRVAFLESTVAEIDIVKLHWLKSVLEKGEFYLYEPTDCLYVSKSTELKHKQFFDEYKDSYTRMATEETLKEVLEEVDKSGDYIHPTVEEIECMGISNPYGVFEGAVVYFDTREVVNDANSATIFDSFVDELNVRFYGGVVSDSFNDEVNVVIIGDDRRREKFAGGCGSVKIYGREFVMESVKKFENNKCV